MIYQKIVAVDLFNYPDEFSIQIPQIVVRAYNPFPARYRFNIRNGMQSKEVIWNDEFSEPEETWTPEESEPSRTQAIKLRELIKLIQQTVEAHPEFEKLPSPGGCA